MKKTWAGETVCDICGEEIVDTLYDARIREGCWATLCESCWKVHGIGLGIGKGQKYVVNSQGEFENDQSKL